MVFLGYPTRMHATPEFARRCGLLCDQDNAAGLAIAPINDGDLATGNDLKGEQVAELCAKRGSASRLGGMHGQKRRHINHDVRVRLVDYFEIATLSMASFRLCGLFH